MGRWCNGRGVAQERARHFGEGAFDQVQPGAVFRGMHVFEASGSRRQVRHGVAGNARGVIVEDNADELRVPTFQVVSHPMRLQIVLLQDAPDAALADARQARKPGRLGFACRWAANADNVHNSTARPSPHFSPGAVMIAEDFGPVRTTLVARSPTESIAGLQSCEGQAPRAPRLKAPLEGARARTGPKDPRGRGQRSPYSARSSASRSTS